MEGARYVTGARYSLITTLDPTGQIVDHLVSGMNSDQADRLWQEPEGPRLSEYMNALTGTVRGKDLEVFTRSIGLVDFRSPVMLSAFMGAPMVHRGVRVGNIYVGSDEPGREFTREDEDALVMLASQAAQAISNARALPRCEKGPGPTWSL